jgi:hypothetical protein
MGLAEQESATSANPERAISEKSTRILASIF